MITLRRITALVALLALILGGLWLGVRYGSGTPTPAPLVLKPTEREIVSYNPDTKTLTTVTPQGTKAEYARTVTVRVQKDGTTVLEKKTWGREFSPFVGVGFGGSLRLHLGVGGFYYKRFDLNGHLTFPTSRNDRGPFIQTRTSLSYNFYRNTSGFLATNIIETILQKKPKIEVGLLVRF